VNLCVADLITILFAYPLSNISFYSHRWRWGAAGECCCLLLAYPRSFPRDTCFMVRTTRCLFTYPLFLFFSLNFACDDLEARMFAFCFSSISITTKEVHPLYIYDIFVSLLMMV
jgi:hypothetical protein